MTTSACGSKRSIAGDDLLDELDAHEVGHAQAGGPGDGALEGLVREGVGNLGKERTKGTASVRVVPPVRAEAQRVAIQHHRLHSGGPHIETE